MQRLIVKVVGFSLRVTKGELAISLALGIVVTGFIALLYSVDPATSWPILTLIGVGSFGFSAYVFQNQRKNQIKWEKHPTIFPNQEGGGIVGVYIERPWYAELAELGRRYSRKAKRDKARPKKS